MHKNAHRILGEGQSWVIWVGQTRCHYTVGVHGWSKHLDLPKKANETLRICLDLPDLNWVVIRRNTSPGRMTYQLTGVKVFSKLDISKTSCKYIGTMKHPYLRCLTPNWVAIDFFTYHLYWKVHRISSTWRWTWSLEVPWGNCHSKWYSNLQQR